MSSLAPEIDFHHLESFSTSIRSPEVDSHQLGSAHASTILPKLEDLSTSTPAPEVTSHQLEELSTSTLSSDVTSSENMHSTTEFKVLIVGAGPAGLALSQLLLEAGISCEVFERDTAIKMRGQGWAVSLKE